MEKKNVLPAWFPHWPSDKFRQAGFRLATIILVLVFSTSLVVQPAFAGGGGANLYVATTGTDTGNCLVNSCRTIAYAMNQASSYDNIHIAAGTYVENLIPNKNLDFYGAGMNATVLDGGGLDVVIYDSSYDLIIMDLTIRNGYHSGSSSGGGIAHWGGTLNLTRVKFLTNHAHFGGGLFSSGPLTMTDCVVTGNSAETYDTTGGYGGGIFLQGTGVTASLVNLTISDNTATGSGGGLHNQNTGTLNLTNVTINGNTAKNNGALSTTNSSTLNLTNSTIAGNHFSASGSNGGIGNWATINFKNTIVAANDGTNCFSGGTLNTLGGNLDSRNDCSFTHPSDYRNTEPLLGPPTDNGRYTETMALLPGSLAIDSGTNIGCPSTDQRGAVRPQDGNLNGSATCDIGAYEFVFTPFGDILVMNGGAWNKYDYASGFYLSGVWTGTAAGCTPVLIDYDGDGLKEYSQLCGGAWHFYNKNASYNKGIWVGDFPGSVPVPGDYNGDGVDEPVLFYAGAWHYFDFATGAYDAALSRWTGTAPGCVPAPMDYTGDGKMKFSLFCGGPWHFYNSDGSYNKGVWIGGSTSNLPAPGDYDGNGTEDVVLFASGVWHFYNYTTGAYDAAASIYTGLPQASAKPAPIDYYKDGTLDFTLYANGTWYFYNHDGSLNNTIATGSPASAVPMTRRFLP